MSVEDKQLCRDLQRELNRRRHLDLSDTKVTVTRGVGYVSGIIRASMGEFLDPKAEAKALQDISRRMHGLRDLVIEAKIEQSSRK